MNFEIGKSHAHKFTVCLNPPPQVWTDWRQTIYLFTISLTARFVPTILLNDDKFVDGFKFQFNGMVDRSYCFEAFSSTFEHTYTKLFDLRIHIPCIVFDCVQRTKN